EAQREGPDGRAVLAGDRFERGRTSVDTYGLERGLHRLSIWTEGHDASSGDHASGRREPPEIFPALLPISGGGAARRPSPAPCRIARAPVQSLERVTDLFPSTADFSVQRDVYPRGGWRGTSGWPRTWMTSASKRVLRLPERARRAIFPRTSSYRRRRRASPMTAP